MATKLFSVLAKPWGSREAPQSTESAFEMVMSSEQCDKVLVSEIFLRDKHIFGEGAKSSAAATVP